MKKVMVGLGVGGALLAATALCHADSSSATVYGQSSTFLIYPNQYGDPIDPATFDPLKVPFAKLKVARGASSLIGKIRMSLMTHGVDVMGSGGFVSATHFSRCYRRWRGHGPEHV